MGIQSVAVHSDVDASAVSWQVLKTSPCREHVDKRSLNLGKSGAKKRPKSLLVTVNEIWYVLIHLRLGSCEDGWRSSVRGSCPHK